MSEETRRKLVTAAAREIEKHGYHGTDSNRIARAAGFSPGTFYKHFNDKQEIFLAAHSAWVDAEWDAVDDLTGPPDTRAAAIVDFVVDHHRRRKGLRASLRALVATDPKVRAFHRSERRRQLVRMEAGPDAPPERRAAAALLLLEVERVADALADGELEALGVDAPRATAHLIRRVREFLVHLGQDSPRLESHGSTAPQGRWIIRDFDADHDSDAVRRIDTSVSTDRVYAVRRHGDGLVLEPDALPTPATKRFPIDLAAEPWAHGAVAVLEDTVCGFIAWGFEPWNRRMTIWHFYVDRPCRGRGAGRQLMDTALDWARRNGAATAWVETSSMNRPGIAAYERLGFAICGFDTTLYRGTPSQDEIAVYLARLIDAD